MGFSNSLASYPDVAALLDKALASTKGLRLTFETPAKATFNRGRINAYRARVRLQNMKVYPAEDPMHGATPYDSLMIKLDGCIVVIEKLDVERFDMEEIK